MKSPDTMELRTVDIILFVVVSGYWELDSRTVAVILGASYVMSIL